MSNLKRYEVYKKESSGNKSFIVILVLILLSLISVGVYFDGVKPIKRALKIGKTEPIETSFIFKKKEVKKEPIIKKEKPIKKVKPKPKKKPIDLTKVKTTKKEVKKEPEKPKTDEKPVKRVFGVKKIYSTGLGTGGSMDDAVVNKLGNTVNKKYDEVKATKKELKGNIVPFEKLTKKPSLNMDFIPKPEYTKEMIKKGVEGVIRAKILINEKGNVTEVEILNDLGYGSAKSVKDACFKLKFNPALVDGEPVSVFYVLKFRLELRT